MNSTSKETSASSVYSPSCPLCGPESRTSLRFYKDGYRIWRCQTCRLLFVHPQPSHNELLSIYSADYYRRGNKYTSADSLDHPNEKLLGENDHDRLAFIRRLKPRGRLLDVGCATGTFLKTAQEAGYRTMGVEVSQAAAEQAKKLGLEIWIGDLPSAALPSEHYDVITLWDVIEHLDNPHPTLAEIRRLLHPDGVVILTTGDASSWWARLMGRRWPLLTPPQHLFFFSPGTIGKVLAMNGMVLQSVHRVAKSATLDLITLKAQEAFGSLVAPWRHLILKIGAGRLNVRLNFGDIITCVGTRASQ